MSKFSDADVARSNQRVAFLIKSLDVLTAGVPDLPGSTLGAVAGLSVALARNNSPEYLGELLAVAAFRAAGRL